MAFVLELKVVPSSGRQQWSIDKSGTLKCHLKSPPEQGKANKELITLIARAIQVSQSSVSIVHGATSRKKVVKVEGNFSREDFLNAIGLELVKQRSLW